MRLVNRKSPQVAAGKLPCSEVLVARHGKVCYRERAGEASAGVALQEDALFRIYSMTKAITTTALMTLCVPSWQLSLHPLPVTVSQGVQAPAVRGRSRLHLRDI